VELTLGSRRYRLETGALVMGVLNRTPDSFYDRGAYFAFDDFLARAEQLVAEGADLLDVGGVKAGPGPEVTTAEELDRVVPAVEALRARFDLPISVDTWRAEVAREAFAAGAILGNDISGFADPDYLPTAAAAGASVVATHIRLEPRVPDPQPVYQDLVGEVIAFLSRRAGQALDAGLPPERVVLDAGLDLGKTWSQSLELLWATDRLSAMGHPVLLSAADKPFLGAVGQVQVGERRELSLAAAALGVAKGARLVRAHDVEGTRRICRTIAAILEAP
jgi:dihydropteroate synthase